MAERDTRKAQEDWLYDLQQLNYSRDENNRLLLEKVETLLQIMIGRAKNGMSNDEIDAVEKRVKEAMGIKQGSDKQIASLTKYVTQKNIKQYQK